MTPAELQQFLSSLVQHQLQDMSLMIWGPPGIGKSSIVAQTAQKYGLDFIDLRLSQLAPTDLRGLPVALPKSSQKKTEGISVWYPPEFLPRDGKGILFLDELNMAPPALQGVAQQLILDRQVGSYRVPQGWYIWAAGNRKEDRAAVYEMPAPLANRFIHLEVDVNFDSFKAYGLQQGLHEYLLAFLSFRPELLHKFSPTASAWPSPRSWFMANRLYQAGLSIAPAVGEGVAAEFNAYIKIYESLPHLEAILIGQGASIPFPQEPSLRYAVTIGLTVRLKTAEEALNAFDWIEKKAPMEWVRLYAVDMLRQIEHKQLIGRLVMLLKQRPTSGLQKYLQEFKTIIMTTL